MAGIADDVIALEEFDKLVKNYNIKCIVETGTWIGNTTKELSTICDEVYSVEIVTELFNQTLKRFKDNPKIKLFNSNSVDFLRENCASIPQPTLYFLDAHWPNIPLYDELRIIAENKLRPVIVIHDFEVPNTNFNNDGFTYNMIHDFLVNIYGQNGYKYYYNEKGDRGPGEPIVGIIYILPV